MQEWTVAPEERGQRLDKFLRRRLPEAPSSFLYRMLRKKNITLNGKKASGSETVGTGDCVTLFLSDETIAGFSSERKGTDGKNSQYIEAYRAISPMLGEHPVLYEDRHVLIVRKPAGILTQKSTPQDLSMNEWLVGYLLTKKNSPVSEETLRFYTPSVCTRLDRNTGGILLCACSLQGSRALTALIRDRKIGKFYQAVVYGKTPESCVIEGFLTKGPDGTMHLSEGKDSPDRRDGKWSKTSYRTLRRGPSFSLLELKIETGRTHQIRAHLAHTGHPVAGDPRYGDSRANKLAHAAAKFKGQLLWCCRIEFPVTQAPELSGISGKSFVCAPPAFYEKVLNS